MFEAMSLAADWMLHYNVLTFICLYTLSAIASTHLSKHAPRRHHFPAFPKCCTLLHSGAIVCHFAFMGCGMAAIHVDLHAYGFCSTAVCLYEACLTPPSLPGFPCFACPHSPSRTPRTWHCFLGRAYFPNLKEGK